MVLRKNQHYECIMVHSQIAYLTLFGKNGTPPLINDLPLKNKSTSDFFSKDITKPHELIKHA